MGADLLADELGHAELGAMGQQDVGVNRVEVLTRHEPRTADALVAASKKYPLKKDVQADDILDALVA